MQSKTFWLITKVEAGRLGMLTTNLAGGGPALPVFSFLEEAEAYLGPGPGRWRVRETAVGELVSILAGPCANVTRVLLDPVPHLDGRVMSELVGMEKKAFVAHLLGPARRRTRASFGKRPIGRAGARRRAIV